jgi:transposase
VTRIVCGVDVSKTALDAHVGVPGGAGAARRFANTVAGVRALAEWCAARQVTLVVMEASGGYERLALALLHEGGIGASVVNPRQVRAFAEAAIQASLTRSLAFLAAEADSLEAEIGALINDDPPWSALDTAFRTIKGVSDRTVACLLADLPEIGLIANKAVAKLVGLAPIINESGTRQGARRTAGGRASVRSILYIVAGTVARFHPTMADFAHRLQKAGKPKMVIRIALAHKLLVILNAKARDARKELAVAT